jgi:extradiol dioxygenase family protein
MGEREILEKIKVLRNKRIVEDVNSKKNMEEIDRNKREWLTFWRRNINLYISAKLGINTFSFQHWSYYLMSDATLYEEITTRGGSKTFRMPVYGFAQCLLKPYTKVVFTANTFGQAQKVLDDKIKPELLGKGGYSPVLRYLYDNGYITIRGEDQSYTVTFFNGSTFKIVPCLDSARGSRATILMFEECRLMKKGMIDSIFENMAQPRQARYMQLPEYCGEEYQEETQTIYITSNRTKHEWFYTLFKKAFVGYFKDKLARDRIFAIDIFVAIKYGLKTKKWYLTKQRTMDSLNFRMEVLNETLGEVEDAYFTYDMFSDNQVLHKAFRPTKDNKVYKNRTKRDDEIRLLYIDIAFAGGKRNDNTVIGCYSAYPNGDNWSRMTDYMETHEGGHQKDVTRRIRELYWDYAADYIVMDLRNGGESFYDMLTEEFIHPELGADGWNTHGFTVINDDSIHMVSSQKLTELRERTVDPDAIPCIIPILAGAEFNSNMWIDLSQRLRNKEIKFLIDDLDFSQDLDGNKKTMFLDNEEKSELRYPYLETMLLINEAVNLTAEWRNGQLKLVNTNTTKDKIVALAYGNYMATRLINKIDVLNAQNNEINVDDYVLIC